MDKVADLNLANLCAEMVYSILLYKLSLKIYNYIPETIKLNFFIKCTFIKCKYIKDFYNYVFLLNILYIPSNCSN